ncbi:hypothetical protein N751_16160 [Legionella pneumophila str. Leg01/11]|nr:hypothetical protein N751_16160 [Legionella pneumophila str. Leg01/11]
MLKRKKRFNTMNIRPLQIKIHSLSMIFMLIKKKLLFIVFLLAIFNYKLIFSCLFSFNLLINKCLDKINIDHQMLYFSAILAINIFVIVNVSLSYKSRKKILKEKELL